MTGKIKGNLISGGGASVPRYNRKLWMKCTVRFHPRRRATHEYVMIRPPITSMITDDGSKVCEIFCDYSVRYHNRLPRPLWASGNSELICKARVVEQDPLLALTFRQCLGLGNIKVNHLLLITTQPDMIRKNSCQGCRMKVMVYSDDKM